MSSSSTLVHSCLRTQLCSCGYKVERFPSFSDGEIRRRRKIRRTNPSLPDDVLTEILLKLPAKTLYQFKHSCKFWYNLIRSHRFISTHYTTHKKDKLSLCCHSYGHISNTITFLFSDIPLNLTVPSSFTGHPKIVGCSYGLVCLSLFRWDARFLLWNPATGDFRGISVDIGCCRRTAVNCVYSGLYFDCVANTHKVVRISILSPYMAEKKVRVYLDVFTVSDNTWKSKKLDISSCEIPRGGSSEMIEVTCVGRFMYWVIDNYDEKHEEGLLCFDMVDELFRKIEIPCVDCHPRNPYNVITEYKGSLAIFVRKAGAFRTSGQSFDMWVLNDDCGSWSKKLTLIPSLPDVKGPIGFYVKGDIELVVLCTDSGYFLWNADSGEATKVLWEGGYIRQFLLYSQSLASVR